jgi:hypothetical protein
MGAEHQANSSGVARGGLARAATRRKRQRLGTSTVSAERLRTERTDHVWAIDFQFDQTADGHNLKLLHVVDEFTREARRSSATAGSTPTRPSTSSIGL